MTWWRRKYIGTVTGKTRLMDGDKQMGSRDVSWILSIRPFGLGRSARRVGDRPASGGSEHFRMSEKVVKAWVAGGPLPALDGETRPRAPAPIFKIVTGGKDQG